MVGLWPLAELHPWGVSHMSTTLSDRNLIPTKPSPSELEKCIIQRWHLLALDHTVQFVCSIFPSWICFAQPDSEQVGFSEHTPTVGQGTWLKNTLKSCSLPVSEPGQPALLPLLSFRRHDISCGPPVMCPTQSSPYSTYAFRVGPSSPPPIRAQSLACPAELPVESNWLMHVSSSEKSLASNRTMEMIYLKSQSCVPSRGRLGKGTSGVWVTVQRCKCGEGSRFAESGVLAAACLPGTGVSLMKSREWEWWATRVKFACALTHNWRHRREGEPGGSFTLWFCH